MTTNGLQSPISIPPLERDSGGCLNAAGPTPARRRLLYTALTAVILLGAGLRLYHLGAKSLWYDEGYYLIHAQSIHSLETAMSTKCTPDPPVFPLMLRAWAGLVDAVAPYARTTPQHDFLLRLLPCLFGILTLPLLYAVVRRLFNSHGAALAAVFLCAISPFQIYYAQELRSYSTYVFLCLAALYFMQRALDENRTVHWLVFILLQVVLMYTHYFSVWTIACFNLYVLVTIKSRWRRLPQWVGYNAIAFVLVLPAIYTAKTIAGFYDNIPNHWYPFPTAKTGLITFKTFFAGYTPEARAYWTLFAIVAALIIIACWKYRRKRSPLALLIILLVVPMIGNIILWNMRHFSMYEHRHFIFSGIAACILAGAGLHALPRWWMRLPVLAAIAAATLPSLNDTYLQRIHADPMHRIGMWAKVDLRAAAAYINANAAEGDVVGHPGHFTWFAALYYCPLEQHILAFSQKDQDRMANNFGSRDIVAHTRLMPQPIQEVAAKARRIWFIESHGLTHDTPEAASLYRGWLEQHGLREDYQVFEDVTIACYRMNTPGRENVIRDQLADYGEAPLVHYRFDDPAQPEAQHLVAAWLNAIHYPHEAWFARFDFAWMHGDDSQILINGNVVPAAAKDGVLVLPQTGQAARLNGNVTIDGCGWSVISTTYGNILLSSYPTKSAGAFAWRCKVGNPGHTPVNLRVRVLESAAVVSPGAFTAGNPLDTVWHPGPQYFVGPPPGIYFAPSMVADLTAEKGDGDSLHAPLALPAAKYSVYVRMFMSPPQWRHTRGQLELAWEGSDAPFASLSGITPADSGDPWQWRHAGETQVPGGPLSLRATCKNANKTTEAYVNLDRVLFLPDPAPPGDTPFITQEFDVQVQPQQEKPIDFKSTIGNAPTKRIDIEFYEPTTRIYRMLTFTVRREIGPPS